MEGLRRFLAIVGADFRERSRSTRFWVVLAGVGIATWWLFPPADAGYTVVSIGGSRGLYSSAWIGMVLGLVYATLLPLFGFYIVRGNLSRDFETRVWQLLVATPMTRPGYLMAKWTSHMAVFGALIAVGLLVGLVAQFHSGESTALSVWQLVLPTLAFALPSLGLTAFLAVLFDLLPWLRRSGGNLLYFFLWITIFIGSVETFEAGKNSWAAHSWLSEPSGISVAMRDLRAHLDAVLPTLDTRDFNIGVIIREGGIGTFVWDAWSPRPMDLVGRGLWMLVYLAGLVALAPVLDWAAARTEATQPGQRSTAGFRLRWLDWLLMPVETFATGRLFAAEARLTLRQRRLTWWLAIGILWVVQFVAPPEGQAIAAIIAWMTCIDVFARAALREHETATSALVFSASGATWRILVARLAFSIVLAMALAAPALVRAWSSSTELGLALMAIASTVGVAGLAVSAACRNPRPFELILVFAAYIGIQGDPLLNAHADPALTLLRHAWLLPAFVVLLGVAWPLSVRRR